MNASLPVFIALIRTASSFDFFFSDNLVNTLAMMLIVIIQRPDIRSRFIRTSYVSEQLFLAGGGDEFLEIERFEVRNVLEPFFF